MDSYLYWLLMNKHSYNGSVGVGAYRCLLSGKTHTHAHEKKRLVKETFFYAFFNLNSPFFSSLQAWGRRDWRDGAVMWFSHLIDTFSVDTMAFFLSPHQLSSAARRLAASEASCRSQRGVKQNDFSDWNVSTQHRKTTQHSEADKHFLFSLMKAKPLFILNMPCHLPQIFLIVPIYYFFFYSNMCLSPVNKLPRN